MKRETAPWSNAAILGPTVAQEAASIVEEYRTTLNRAKEELAREIDWMETIKKAYGLTDDKVSQIGRSFNRLKFWQNRISEYEQLLAPFQAETGEVTG